MKPVLSTDINEISDEILSNGISPAERIPFLLFPAAKDYLWGGTRLNDDFSKNLDVYPLAETWECSTHPNGLSLVRSGTFTGMTLLEVLRKHPDFMGSHPETKDGLPILVKFIDAKGDLSIQVHPDDEYARVHEQGSLGKIEMWYVIEASKDAYLIYGLKHEMIRDEVRISLKNGTFEKQLRRVPVKKGDVFIIPPGQIHAVCSGCLIAEIQESSDITYRLYDYDRIDKTGKKRELNIEKALDVAILKEGTEPRQPMKVIRFRRGVMIESLFHCSYFQVEKLILDTQRCRELASFKTRGNSFCVLLCIEGCGSLSWRCGSLNFFRGDCIFVPADSVQYRALGEAVMLRVSC